MEQVRLALLLRYLFEPCDLRGDGRIVLLEGVLAQHDAAQLLEACLEAGADRLVVLDRGIEQAVGGLPALVVPRPLRNHRAAGERRVGHGEGVGADALHAHLRVGGAERDDHHLVAVSHRRGGGAHVVVARDDHEVGAVGDHLLPGPRAFRRLRLGVGLGEGEITAAEHAAGFVDVVDRHLRRPRRRAVVLVHPAAERDGEADDDIVVGCLARRGHADRKGKRGRARQQRQFTHRGSLPERPEVGLLQRHLSTAMRYPKATLGGMCGGSLPSHPARRC